MDKPSERRASKGGLEEDGQRIPSEDFDEDEIVIGSMDLEASTTQLGKVTLDSRFVRPEAVEIVHGAKGITSLHDET